MTCTVEKVVIRDRPWFHIDIDGAEFFQRATYKPGLEAPPDEVERLLIRLCEAIVVDEPAERPRDELSETDQKFMERFGWELIETGPEQWEWRKFSVSGQVMAHEGDPTWQRDLKAARE